MTARKIAGWLFTAAVILIPAGAMAQSPTKAQQDAIRSNCRSDFMKNCSSVKPGGREALDCLMQNRANVSGGCQGALNAVAGPPPAAAKPEPKPEPKQEAVTPPPASAPVAAPASPEAPKAPPPAAAKPAAPKAAKAPAKQPAPMEAAPPPPAAGMPAPADAGPQKPMRLGEAIMIRRYCFNDFKVLCKGTPIGQGRAVKCLVDNTPALSPGCRQAMATAGY